jgi:hypothetical protein
MQYYNSFPSHTFRRQCLKVKYSNDVEYDIAEVPAIIGPITFLVQCIINPLLVAGLSIRRCTDIFIPRKENIEFHELRAPPRTDEVLILDLFHFEKIFMPQGIHAREVEFNSTVLCSDVKPR